MFNEHDSVLANQNLTNRVPIGTIGVVVICYREFDENSKDYEVEFFDSEYNTIEILTVSEDKISTLVQ